MNLQNENRKLRQTRFILILIIFLLFVVSIVSYDRALKLQTTNTELLQKNEQLVNDNSTIQARYSLSQRFLMDARVKLLRDYENASQAIIEEIRATYYIDDIPLTLDEQRYIYRLTDKHNFDYKNFLAIMKTESEFEQYAKNINTSGSQDISYMQVSSPNHDDINKQLGRELDYYKFEDNILGAIVVLNWFEDDNIKKQISMYNMGYLANEFYREHGHYETPYYKKVMENKEVLFNEKRKYDR